MTSDHLSHSDILFMLFSLGGYIDSPNRYIGKYSRGHLIEQGFYWTTEYFRANESFFEEKRHKTPDGHIKSTPISLLATVEVTTNPYKENLFGQIEFYCSNKYKQTVVDTKYHEVWIYVPHKIYNDFIGHFTEGSKNLVIQNKTPIIIHTIDYDKKKYRYIVKQAYGEHYDFIERNKDINLRILTVEKPEAFPLLSPNLSIPSVMFSIGSDFLKKIKKPPPPKDIKDILNEEERYAISSKVFKKCVNYLVILCPQMLEIENSGGHKILKIKQNPGYYKEISAQLRKIRSKSDEKEIIEMVKSAVSERNSEKRKERKGKRKTKRLSPAQTRLDNIFDDIDKFMD